MCCLLVYCYVRETCMLWGFAAYPLSDAMDGQPLLTINRVVAFQSWDDNFFPRYKLKRSRSTSSSSRSIIMIVTKRHATISVDFPGRGDAPTRISTWVYSVESSYWGRTARMGCCYSCGWVVLRRRPRVPRRCSCCCCLPKEYDNRAMGTRAFRPP